MYQIQTDKLAYFNKQINNHLRKITYRFTLNDKDLPIDNVMDNPVLTTDSGLEQYGVGSALVTQLQMSVKNDVLIIPKDKIKIEIGLEIFNEVTNKNEILYSPLGVFYVDVIEEKGITKTLKAYDGMYRLNKGYFPSAKHTTTQAIANDIATTNGYKLKGITNVTINNEQLQGKTCIEMLSLVASAMGTNVRISRDGSTIEFVEPIATNLTFDESHLSTATLDDTTSYNITKLRVNYSDQVTNDNGVVTDEGYFTVGTGTDSNTLEVSNPLLKGKQSQATNVLNKIKKLNGYKRFDTTMPFADYRIEPMDLVIYSKAGVSYLVPILYMKMTLSYRGISIETQSPTLAPTKSEFSFKGTLTQKVENIYTDIIHVKQLTANKVTTDQLEATVATIEKLYATKAEIGELVAGSIVVEELKVQVAEIDKLVANKADITDLTVLNATINSLKAQVADIDNLIAGSILAEIIQSGSISSDLLNVKDGFIKDAMIGSLSASKINTGVINTNNVSIQSDNGNMLLQGNLLQFKDKNEKVRIQIGQDTKGNYTFTLYDSTGKGVLINQDGIQSSNAIKDGLIVDSKVADNANISGSKLNISSLYDSMNADGSKTLKASKVYLDDKGQTLDVSFKEMTTKQDDLQSSMNTAITDINVSKGQISQLIQDTTIVTANGTTKLKDAYNSTKSTVDGHTTQIGKMESTIVNQGNGISDLTNRMTNAESKITDTAITNVVKQNFYTKTETDKQITSKGYATSSQVQQTVDALQIKFSQSGGYNLLRNGKASLNTNYWVSNGGGISRATDAVYKTCYKTKLPSGIVYSGGDNGGAIRLKNNTHYVYEAMIRSSVALTGSSITPLHFWCNTTPTGADTPQCIIIDYSQSVPTANKWTKCYVHFQTKESGEVWFTPFIYTGGSYTNDIWVTELSLSESIVQMPYSPHPSEVYDGIVLVDKDGIEVSTSKGAYTRFSADGMNSFNNNGEQTLGIRNGGMTFYAYDNNEYVGYISQSVKGTSSANGVSIGISPQGEYLSLGLSSVSDPNSGFAQTSKFVVARGAIASQNMSEGLNAYAHLDMHGWNLNNVDGVNVNGGINIKGNGMIKFDSTATYPSAIWEDTSSGNLAVFGDNGVVLGYKNGATNTNIVKISETNDSKGCKINSYHHHNFNDWTMYNMNVTYDGFARASGDNVKMFKLSSAKESNFCVQVANDYVTYFNIQANNYVDGGKYIARFHYWNGSSASSQGIHFYRALNMHGYNITNVGNMNVLGLTSEEVVANDIKIASPYSIMSRSGEVEALSVVKSTDDVTEHNDTVTVTNGRAEVYLPMGLVHMGYLVQATPNKLVKIAVTEKLDDHFIIEVDSEEEVEVDYCIKAFQPKYATRASIYGELQGEESPQAITAEEAEEAGKSDIESCNSVMPVSEYTGGDTLYID